MSVFTQFTQGAQNFPLIIRNFLESFKNLLLLTLNLLLLLSIHAVKRDCEQPCIRLTNCFVNQRPSIRVSDLAIRVVFEQEVYALYQLKASLQAAEPCYPCGPSYSKFQA